MKQLLCLLLTGILAVTLGIYLFHRSRVARAEGQAAPPMEVTAEADQKEASTTYEPPSVELLRLRSEVARLREEAAELETLWQAETNRATEARGRLIQSERGMIALQRENDHLRQQIDVAQRVRRTGPWVGAAVNDAADGEQGIVREGVSVAQVSPKGPAIGLLKPGDVITAVNGRPVPDTASFMKMLTEYPPETTFHFDIVRKGVSSFVTVTSKRWPE